MPQTLTQIRAMLEQAGLSPRKMFGQNFLIDHNLLARLVELSGVRPGERVLEVGPGTGVLTEHLLQAGCHVLAVEIDRGLAGLLQQRLGGHERFRLLNADVLSGKHAVNPQVIQALRALPSEGLAGQARMISNLPYNIATPLVAECLRLSCSAEWGDDPAAVRFAALAFTVQREVAQRFAAGVGEEAYGPVSVLVALLGRVELGPNVPPEAFWPRPTITSRMMRIDVRAPAPGLVPRLDVLQAVVSLCFCQRRKKIGSAGRRAGSAFSPEGFAAALERAGISPDLRPEQVPPEAFARLAAELSADR